MTIALLPILLFSGFLSTFSCSKATPISDLPCSLTLYIPSLRQAHFFSLAITNYNKYVCIETPLRDFSTMLAMSSIPTDCVFFLEDVFENNAVKNTTHTVFKALVRRNQCVGGPRKKGVQEELARFVVAVKPAYFFADNVGIDTNVPLYLGLVALLGTLAYFPVKRWVYGSAESPFINRQGKEE